MCVCVCEREREREWEYTFRLKVIKNFFFVSLWMSNVKAQVEEFQSFLTGTNKINLSSLSKWQKIENWELQTFLLLLKGTKICFQIVFNQTSFGIVDVFPQEYGRELETDINCICLFLFIFLLQIIGSDYEKQRSTFPDTVVSLKVSLFCLS